MWRWQHPVLSRSSMQRTGAGRRLQSHKRAAQEMDQVGSTIPGSAARSKASCRDNIGWRVLMGAHITGGTAMRCACALFRGTLGFISVLLQGTNIVWM